MRDDELLQMGDVKVHVRQARRPDGMVWWMARPVLPKVKGKLPPAWTYGRSRDDVLERVARAMRAMAAQ
jgi:hypothetical protein